MPKTVLAVDDSVTMRKVIEMTFAGEDLRVVTASSAQDALAKCRKEQPDVVLADVSLDDLSGYDLCRAIKDEFVGVPIILLSSKQNPFDPAKGQTAGADDHIDKPYDTGKCIELVKKVLERGKSVAPAPMMAASVMGSPAPRAAMFATPTPVPVPVAAPAPTPRPVAVVAAAPPVLAPTSTLSGIQAIAKPAPAVSMPRPGTAAIPAAASVGKDMPVELKPKVGSSPLPPEMQRKLDDIGLTPSQVEAVLALSKEIVEKVVWEVVPVLAETMVREEIARLTREA